MMAFETVTRDGFTSVLRLVRFTASGSYGFHITDDEGFESLMNERGGYRLVGDVGPFTFQSDAPKPVLDALLLYASWPESWGITIRRLPEGA